MKTTFIRKRPSQAPQDQTPAAYETPRAASQAKQGNLLEISDGGVNLTEDIDFYLPLRDEELFQLADMRLKEIFNQYAKTYATTAGKALTFDRINRGYESLTQFGLS